MILPQFERVPKAEIYSTKLEKGINMGKVQKVYTKEFKQEAVRLVETSGKPITQIARELGISDSAIHSWRKELATHGTAETRRCSPQARNSAGI